VILLVVGGYLFVRWRYERAHDEMAFQIQSVIDLEANALGRGDRELFLAQQDQTAALWVALQAQRAARCTADRDVSDSDCAPVMPAQVEQVDLHGEVAWVEVVQGAPPVRRVRFYRQTRLGWKHTTPHPAFWDARVEVHRAGLVFHLHVADRPYVDALIDQAVAVHREMCAALDCPADRSVQVVFTTLVPGESVPSDSSVAALPSPWHAGIPVEGGWGAEYVETVALGVARAVVRQSVLFQGRDRSPLERALLDEYAAWQVWHDPSRVPILGRIVGRGGEGALREVLRWLADVQANHTLDALLRRWLSLSPNDPASYFQALLDIEHEALLSGQRETFMLLQDGKAGDAWVEQQQRYFDRAQSVGTTLPRPQVRKITISRGHAVLTLADPPPLLRGSIPQALGQYAFWTRRGDDWKRSSALHALYWDIPLVTVRPSEVSPVPDEARPAGGVTVAFLTSEHGLMQTWARQFEARYPDTHIELVSFEDVLALPDPDMGADLHRVYLLYQYLLYQAAAVVDVVHLPISMSPAIPDLFRDLGPWFDKELPRDLYPGLLTSCQWMGRIWCLPWRAYPSLIYFDPAAFDEAGLFYPRPGWTTDDLLAAARALTVRSDGMAMRYGFVDAGGWPMARAFIEGRAGPLLDRTRYPWQPRLDAPGAVDAVRWYGDLALRYGVMPAVSEVVAKADGGGYWNMLWAVVQSGRAAMWTDSLSSLERWGELHGARVAPYPESVGPSNPWTIESLMLSAYTAHPDESWLWMRFVSEQAAEPRQKARAFALPARRSVAEASGYWQQWDAETRSAIEAALDRAYALSLDACTVPLNEAIQEILSGMPAEEAMAKAQDATVGATTLSFAWPTDR